MKNFVLIVENLNPDLVESRLFNKSCGILCAIFDVLLLYKMVRSFANKYALIGAFITDVI